VSVAPGYLGLGQALWRKLYQKNSTITVVAKNAAPRIMPQSVKILMSDFSLLAEGFSSSDGTMLETLGQVPS
jgi:hypothetical protein